MVSYYIECVSSTSAQQEIELLRMVRIYRTSAVPTWGILTDYYLSTQVPTDYYSEWSVTA